MTQRERRDPDQASPDWGGTRREALAIGELVSRVARVAWAEGEVSSGEDMVAAEAPLEIRVGGRSLAVVMRSPGEDDHLVRGFLLSEGIVRRPEEIVSLRHCSAAPEDDVMNVTLAEGVEVDWARLARSTFASSSCGVCGKRTRAAAMGLGARVDGGLRVPVALLYGLPERLLRAQVAFGLTGGLHAAGFFDERGEFAVVHEDVGRHNAVDKVIGWAAARGHDLSGGGLMVSGRVSFEIVQKAVAARVALIAAVSAPTSLAVDTAAASGLTLVGFLRGRKLSVYAGGERIVGMAEVARG